MSRLQQALTDRGFNPQGVDGAFGNNTKSAVMAFQRAQGIKVDGIVGPDTARRLFGSTDAKFFDGVSDFATPNTPPTQIHDGGNWGGSEGVADLAKTIASGFGAPVTSEKRNYADTIRVGSNTGSDHYTGNTNAYAVDFAASGSRGDQLARAIADAYGIPRSNIGTYNHTYVTIDGQRYRLQLLWKVEGHYDHVHLGIRRA
ncbi:MAG: peptidoglycan-binding domain-containing protein [Archangium sp.]